MIDDDMSFIC